MVAYQVNGELIFNIYLALHKSWKTGHDIRLYCYDHEYDQLDWTQEPEQHMDVLMAQHAHNLRARYERIILLWSGGTDSHTIYNVFKHNNIHVDEILVCANTRSTACPDINYQWLVKNHWDPTTIITRYDNYDTDMRAIDITDDNWIWRNKGDLFKYTTVSSGDAVEQLIQRNHAGTAWKAIAGYEKPRLVHRQGVWYSRQLGMVLQPSMGHDYIDHFFLEPLIAMKQAHLLRRNTMAYLQRTNTALHEGDWAESKWPWTPAGYRALSRAGGRHDEANLGVSFGQKNINNEFDKTNQLELITDWRKINTIDARLKHDLSQGNRVAENYVRGFYNLTAEHGFRSWLIDNHWMNSNDLCFTDLKFVWSKEYALEH
jgi:hypothetical protein